MSQFRRVKEDTMRFTSTQIAQRPHMTRTQSHTDLICAVCGGRSYIHEHTKEEICVKMTCSFHFPFPFSAFSTVQMCNKFIEIKETSKAHLTV